MTYPTHFLLLQVPELSIDLVQSLIRDDDRNRIALIILLVLPYFSIATYLTRSLTYISAVQSREGTPLFTVSLREIGKRWKILIPVSLLTGVLFLIGFAALVLPAIYFLTIYLFVPALIVTESPSPWSSYLYKSKRLVNTALPKTLLAVIIMLGLSAVLEFDIARAWVTELLPQSMPPAFTYGAKLAIMAVVGALCSLWITFHFESLRAKS